MTTALLAIDPGPVESAFVVYSTAKCRPMYWEKLPSGDLLDRLGGFVPYVLVVEMVASYGMAVGAETFETCVWAGRFIDRWETTRGCAQVRRVFRREVKLHLCHDSRAKDANIRQALIDRYGGKAQAIGRKATPGPLYGITGDVWQALGVAITAAETAP